MGIEEGFLADILAHPDDDTPRLIYADWLEERGDVRGEFIRVQCELARRWPLATPTHEMQPHMMPPARLKEWPEFDALRRRERELLATMLDTGTPTQRSKTLARVHWAKPVLGRYVHVWPHEFRRGFVERVTLTAADFLQHAAALRAATPLREVTLKTLPPLEGGGRSNHTYRPIYRVRGLGTGVIGNPGETTSSLCLRVLHVNFEGLTFTLDPGGGFPVPPEFVDALVRFTEEGVECDECAGRGVIAEGFQPELPCERCGGTGRRYVLRGNPRAARPQGLIDMRRER